MAELPSSSLSDTVSFCFTVNECWFALHTGLHLPNDPRFSCAFRRLSECCVSASTVVALSVGFIQALFVTVISKRR